MASSDKPDFIEIDQKEAPVKLTTGAETSADGAAEPVADAISAETKGATPGASGSPERVSETPKTPSSSPTPSSNKAFHPKMNDDFLALGKNKAARPGSSMRKLPGGSFMFIGLLAVVCMFGTQLDVLRNQTLTDLASGFAVDRPGYVETVADLSESYAKGRNVAAAKQVLEKAMADLAAKGEAKGAKGAFILLKLAMLDFNNDNFNDARTTALKALDMLRAGGSYVPYETGFALYDVAWQFDNNWDYKDGVLFNEEARGVWPRERPNYRADMVADIGFEYNRLKQFDKAEQAYKESLNQSARQGDGSRNVWRLAQLGQAQVGQKKYSDAELNLNSALNMENRLHEGRKTTHLAQIYTDLGRVKAGLGDMKSAQDYFEKSAKILERRKNDSYYYLINQLQLANLYRDTGHPEKARPLYGALLRRLHDGEHGPDLNDVNREFDLLLAQTGGK